MEEAEAELANTGEAQSKPIKRKATIRKNATIKRTMTQESKDLGNVDDSVLNDNKP